MVTIPTGRTSWSADVVKASGYRKFAHETVKVKIIAAMIPGIATGMKMRVSICI